MKGRSMALLWGFTLWAAIAAAQTGRPLTLAQALELAESSHPALKAAETQVRGAEALLRQADTRPNPEISLQSENWRLNGPPDFRAAQELDVFAFASQTLETGGKRARRVETAGWDVKIAGLERQALRWRIRQDVRRAFLRAILAQKQLEILQESGRHFRQIVEYQRVRVEQGAMAESDLIKVQLEQERLSLAENTAAVEAERARIDVLRAVGATDYDANLQLEDAAAPPPGGPVMNQDALLALAREKRADLLAGQAQVERALAQKEWQKAQAKPDWTFMFGYKRTTGFDTLLAGVTVPLPIFDRNLGNIFHSETEIDRARFLLNSSISQMRAEVAGALAAIRRNRAALDRMHKAMLEQAEESRRISYAAYQEGGADLLRLLDAQRVSNEVQLLHTRTEMEYRLSLAALEEAVGEENLQLSEELLRVQP